MDNDPDNKNYPSLLLEVGVPILSLKHCQQLFENWKVGIEYTYKGRIFGGNICAGAEPGRDSCTVSFISIFSLLFSIFVAKIYVPMLKMFLENIEFSNVSTTIPFHKTSDISQKKSSQPW